MKAFTGSARVTLSETDFGIASNNGSHVMPWGLFKESYRDSKNLFLFLSKTAAIVIPKKGVPPAAVEFMVDHVRRGRSGQGPVLAA
jgi:hypothetical protein